MADVRVKITTEADLSGAAKTGEEFQKIYVNAEKTREAFEKLSSVSGKSAAESAKVFQEAARGRQDASDAAGALSDMTREAKGFSGEVEQKVEPALHRMAKGFKDLGREIPLVGVAIRAFANPWTFVGAAVAGAVVWFQRMISVQNELAQASADLSARLDPLIVRQVRTKQLQTESALAAEEFNRKLNAQADALRTIHDRQSDANDQLERRNKLEAAIEDADKELALARAGGDPEARAAVEKEFAERKRVREGNIAGGKIAAAFMAMKGAQQVGLEAEAALPGARADLTAAEEAAGGRLDDVNAALGVHDQEAEDLKKGLADAELFARGPFSMPGVGITAERKRDEARAAVESHRTRRDELLARKKRIEADTAPERDRVSQLEMAVSRSRDTVPGLERNYRQLIGDASTDRAIFESTKGTLEEARKLVTTQAELKEALKQSAELQRQAAREQAEVNRELRSIIKSNHGR